MSGEKCASVRGKECALGEDGFGEGGGDGDHGFVDDLGELQAHGDGAEQVGVLGGEVPVGDEEVDHTLGGVASGGKGVGVGFDGEVTGADCGCGGGFDERAGERRGFVEGEAECGVGGALDAVDADLAVALGCVGVAAGEERAGLLDGEVQRGAGGELADIEVAAEWAGWACAVLAGFGGCDAHDATEGAQWNDGGRE